ncbi:DUF3429 domain-containing protein [Maritimibacter sp. HL-12]|jgi:hypothetical protein|uniref:DUF3429 domain-containing protein n=1 Tax=Maritimibacter sp. HL-12 TaxID=1162418 RepID=UPI000A0F2983|nr:DUF3429 domain-containing protein [Maritimibacter sp. HL-12]SMH47793.1 Protein of unknown function [Maritimibacter sp. HL-12]
MTAIPRAPLLLGLAGLLPFVWGAATVLWPELGVPVGRRIGIDFVAVPVLAGYGKVILAFMSGVIWGFAARANDHRGTLGYGLAVIPALWAFFLVVGATPAALIFLIAGFIGLLGIDALFWRHGLAPGWWMRLRIMLTIIVVVCLAVGLIA